MRKIIIDIDAGEKNCAGCTLLKDRWRWKARCPIYGMTYTDILRGQKRGRYPRLPACLAAEARLTRLVEAAKEYLRKGEESFGEDLADVLKEIEHE